jgi:prefoldin subunit 5
MEKQKKHLENVISQQKSLISEIEELNKEMTLKRENAIKLQGIIEYLNTIIKEEEESKEKSIENQ